MRDSRVDFNFCDLIEVIFAMSEICRTKSPTRVASRKGRRKKVECIDTSSEEKEEINSLLSPSLCYLKKVVGGDTESNLNRGRSGSCDIRARSNNPKQRSFSEANKLVESLEQFQIIEKKKLLVNSPKVGEEQLGASNNENVLETGSGNTKSSSPCYTKNGRLDDDFCLLQSQPIESKENEPIEMTNSLTEHDVKNLRLESITPKTYSSSFSKSTTIVKKISTSTGKEEDIEKNRKVYNLKPIKNSSLTSSNRISLYNRSKTSINELNKIPQIRIAQPESQENSAAQITNLKNHNRDRNFFESQLSYHSNGEKQKVCPSSKESNSLNLADVTENKNSHINDEKQKFTSNKNTLVKVKNLALENIADTTEITNPCCNGEEQKLTPNECASVKKSNLTPENLANFTKNTNPHCEEQSLINECAESKESNLASENSVNSENKSPPRKKWINPYLRSRGGIKKLV